MKSKFIWLFLLALALVSLGSQAYADWNTAQGDQQRTGLSPYAVDESKLRHAWTVNQNVGWRATASSPAIHGDTVYAVWGVGAAANRNLSSHDINTGALNWTYLIPGASRTTPAVYNVDTTGLGDYALLIFIGNGSTTSGVAGVDAVRIDGTLFRRYLLGLGEGGVVGSTPVLVDTGATAGPDLLIAGTGRLASLRAWGITGPGTAASSPWFYAGLEPDPSYTILNSLALSADDSIVYAGTADFGISWAGHVYAVNTRTGALLGNIFRAGSSFVANPTVLGSGEVLSLGFNTLAATNFGRRVYLSPRLLGTFNRTPFDNGNQRGGGALWPDVSGDTFYYASSEDFDLLMGWSVQAIRAFTNNPASLVALQPICNFPPSPVAISASGTGIVSTGFFGAYNKVNIFDPATGFLLWTKPYVGANTITGFNRSNAAIADGAANDSGVVVILQDGAGFLIALKEDPTGYARWELEPVVSVGDGCPEIFMNISTAGGGTDTDTGDFINVGTASGSYTAIVAMSAQAGATGKSSMQVRYSNVSRPRQNLALKLSDDMATLANGKFMPKSTASFLSEVSDERAEELLQATSFQLKQKPSAYAASSPPPAWLTLTDLDGGGPIAPGGTASVEAIANSATLALGEYFADIELTVTPDDPDPDYYGGTEIIYPIHLVVGFIKNEAYVDASDASLLITNAGQIGNFEHGSGGTDIFITSFGTHNEFFAGSPVVSKDAVCIFWHNNDTTGHFIPDQNLISYGLDPNAYAVGAPYASAYIDSVNICTTAFVTNNSLAGKTCCSLRVEQITVGIWDGAWCDSVIAVKYVYNNVGSNNVTGLKIAQWCDWDVDAVSNNLVFGDEPHGVIWASDDPGNLVSFGHFRLPELNGSANHAVQGYSVNNPTYLHPNGGHNWQSDQLDSLMSLGAWDVVGADPGAEDKGILLTTQGVDILAGGHHIEEYIIFGWDNANGDFHDAAFREALLKAWLRQHGYFRGDVNTDNRGHERSTANADLGPATDGGKINVTDVVYLAKYVLSGTARPWPFDDQGDVSGNGLVTLQDVIALANLVFKGVSIDDRNRFGPGSRPSLKESPNWY